MATTPRKQLVVTGPGLARTPLAVFVSEELVQPICLVNPQTRLGLNLDGKTLRATIRASLAEAILITDVSGVGIVHDPDQVANPGLLIWTVLVADHAALGAFEHVWDLWVDDEVWVAPALYDVRDSVRFGS